MNRKELARLYQGIKKLSQYSMGLWTHPDIDSLSHGGCEQLFQKKKIEKWEESDGWIRWGIRGRRA